MNKLELSALALAKASDGNPFIMVATIMLFYVMFNLFLGLAEKLIFGERFEHFMDLIFILCFMGYSGLSVWICAAYQESKKI